MKLIVVGNVKKSDFEYLTSKVYDIAKDYIGRKFVKSLGEENIIELSDNTPSEDLTEILNQCTLEGVTIYVV